MKTILFVVFVIAGANCDLLLSKESNLFDDVSPWPYQLIPLETNKNVVSISPYQLYNLNSNLIEDAEVVTDVGGVSNNLSQRSARSLSFASIFGAINKLSKLVAFVTTAVEIYENRYVIYEKIKSYVHEIVKGYDAVMEFLGLKSKASAIDEETIAELKSILDQFQLLDGNVLLKAFKEYFVLLKSLVEKFLDNSKEEIKHWSLGELEKFVRKIFEIEQ